MAEAAETDFYALLGVDRNATDEELKKGYRAKARQLHPDANREDPHAEEKFKQVTLAYEVLKDPEKRRRYDQYGIDGIRGMGTGGGPNDPFAGFGNLGDIFEAFFGGSSPFAGGRTRGPSGPPRGADLESIIDLSFEEAVFGSQAAIDLRLPVPCDTCAATGSAPGTAPVTCRDCNGAGEIRRMRHTLLGQMMTSTPCGRCGASGLMIDQPCPTCRGEGRRTEHRTCTVDVPAGVDTGSTLRVTGRGAAGPRGGANGDLYVHIRVKPHTRFQRDGYDLIEHLEIPMTQATLGAHLKYSTLDGEEDLIVAPGTQGGRVLQLRGRGVPHVNGRGRGDLLLTLNVATPTGLTKAQEDLLRTLAGERGEEVAPPDKGFFSRLRSAFK